MLRPRKLFHLLLKKYGSQGWWPAKTKFEVIVGALLTQQTRWEKVEVAIINLKRAHLLSLRALARANPKKVEKLIKPVSFYRQKSKRLVKICRYISKYGSLKRFFRKQQGELRRELLSLEGIGRETADSIILYAAGMPSFVIDNYTIKLLERLGYGRMKYEEAKDMFEKSLPEDARLFGEFHALIVRHGKNCKKTYCAKCPLYRYCTKKQDMPGRLADH